MKKIKTLMLLALCMIFVSATSQPVHANLEADIPLTISPRYTYISVTTTSLSNVSGNASCTAHITSKSSSDLKVFLYLEKKINGTWIQYGSWYENKTGSYLTVKQNVSVSSGTYRVRASYYANGENILKYSAEKNF